MLVAYAEALEQGDLASAHALVDPAQAGSLEAFEARYAEEAVRKARAAEIRASLEEVRTAAPGVAAVERDGWRVVDASPAEARQTLETFLAAAEGGDFDAAYRLLSGRWRSAYTPARLKQDFQAEPEASDRLARARQALRARPELRGGEVAFPIGEGKAVRLVREGDAFRVAALE